MGATVAFIGAAAIDVYLLGHVERMKGPNTTFQILVWLAPVVALVTAIAYMLATKTWSFVPSGRASFVTGSLISMLFWPSGWVGQFLPSPFSIGFTWFVCLGGSFLAVRIIRGSRTHGSAPANS